jgi:formylglycine-generating enzyme required for sulfatase activity
VIARALFALAALATVASASPVRVGPGTYRPAFPASPAERAIEVRAFWLDRTPVTNAEFLAFVRAQPAWRRDRAKRILADERYLEHWGTADSLGTARAKAPVVRVSWFAARAYCAWRGGRLPLEREWELAAAADASADPKFQTRILTWYAELAPAVLPDTGRTKNAWGAHDMHGLVWEWIEDYNAALVTADAREPATRFCGGAAASAKDGAAYATFMRFAFRSSLQASFTTAALGFRCAYDQESP